jgi:hypothetical protein
VLAQGKIHKSNCAFCTYYKNRRLISNGFWFDWIRIDQEEIDDPINPIISNGGSHETTTDSTSDSKPVDGESADAWGGVCNRPRYAHTGVASKRSNGFTPTSYGQVDTV